jgi:hypothetical protein
MQADREILEGQLSAYVNRGYRISRDGFEEGITTPSGCIHTLEGSLISKGGATVPEDEAKAVADIAKILFYLGKKD